MTIVALGKQVFTILYIESLKSIVTSLTFSRSSLGIFSRIALTVSAFCTLYRGYKRLLHAVASLAGQEHIDLAANLSLVNTAILAQIPRQQHPVNGMVFLLPVIKTAQAFLVVPPKRTWL